MKRVDEQSFSNVKNRAVINGHLIFAREENVVPIGSYIFLLPADLEEKGWKVSQKQPIDSMRDRKKRTRGYLRGGLKKS